LICTYKNLGDLYRNNGAKRLRQMPPGHGLRGMLGVSISTGRGLFCHKAARRLAVNRCGHL
jgi:hypothetical protein